MELNDDGTVATPLNVTGTLTGGSNITVDFGRYYDTAFRELQTQIGSAAAGSSLVAGAEHVATWNAVAGVNFADGAIVLAIWPRGGILIIR